MPLPFARPRLTQSLARRFRLRGFSRSALDETTFPVVIVDDLSKRADFNTGPIEAVGFSSLGAVGGQRAVAQLFNDGGVDILLRVNRLYIANTADDAFEMFVGTTVLGAVRTGQFQDRRFAARITIGGARGLNLVGGLGGTQIAAFRQAGSRGKTYEFQNLLIPRGTGVHIENVGATGSIATWQWDEIPDDVN